MSNAQLQGLIVPIVLPMRTDGQPELDELAARRQTDREPVHER